MGSLRDLDPDSAPELFRRGERAWILQSDLFLLRAGLPVELSDRVPEDGIVVFHAKHERDLARLLSPDRRVTLAGVRADNREPLLADFQVVQNGCFADGRRRFFIPPWPQPGLRPRDPERGSRVEVLA